MYQRIYGFHNKQNVAGLKLGVSPKGHKPTAIETSGGACNGGEADAT